MFEGMSEEEKALAKEFIDKKREGNQMTINTNVANMQSKADRFQKLVGKRLARTLNELDLISNLSTSRYDFTEEQANEVLEKLNGKLNYIEGMFKRRIDLKAKKAEKLVATPQPSIEEE